MLALIRIRRHKGRTANQTGIIEEAGNVSTAAQVFRPTLRIMGQNLTDAQPHRFARAGSADKHIGGWFLSITPGALFFGDIDCANRSTVVPGRSILQINHACTNGHIGQAIYHNKGTGAAVLSVAVDAHSLLYPDLTQAYFVQLK